MSEYIEFVGGVCGANIRAPAGALRNPRRIEAEVFFPAGHPGFQGHFPSHPLLPGFLHIQAVLDVLSFLGGSVDVAMLREAKFLRPIRPGERLQITIDIHPGRVVRAGLHVAGAPACVLELELSGAWPAAGAPSQNR